MRELTCVSVHTLGARDLEEQAGCLVAIGLGRNTVFGFNPRIARVRQCLAFLARGAGFPLDNARAALRVCCLARARDRRHRRLSASVRLLARGAVGAVARLEEGAHRRTVLGHWAGVAAFTCVAFVAIAFDVVAADERLIRHSE